MKILIYFICFLVLISTVHSLRQRFGKSRNLSPRGHRHHIFNNVNPAKTSNKEKTTQVTKIVTVSDNGKETVKKFNHHDNQLINNWDSNQQNHQSNNHGQNHKVVKKFSNHGQAIDDYDYQSNHPAHNQNWEQKRDHHPPNPYPDFDNPYLDGSFPTNPNFNPHIPNIPSRPFPPNPPPDSQMFSVQLPPWNVPKYKEYTTKCCTVINITSTDHSKEVEKECDYSCPEDFSAEKDPYCEPDGWSWQTGNGEYHKDESFTIKCVNN